MTETFSVNIYDDFTDIQKEVINDVFADEKYTRIMLLGGSRSGKTFLIIWLFILLCFTFPGCKLCVLRHLRKDVKKAVWNGTLTKVLAFNHMREGFHYTRNEGDLVLTIGSSSIWFGGLDEKERVDNILGNEFLHIFFNESSQISYDAITTALTRLSQLVIDEGTGKPVVNRAFFDMNPPGKFSWSYKMFVMKRYPHDNSALVYAERYIFVKMNPDDNRRFLAKNYIEETLDILPERKKRRFRHGEFTVDEGVIFDEFNADTQVIGISEVPEIEWWSKGTDFGLHCAAVLIGWCGDNAYIVDEAGGFNITAEMLQGIMTLSGWDERRAFNYCDPSGGERIQSITGGVKAKNDVESGLDFMLHMVKHNLLFVVSHCARFLNEFTEYKRNEFGFIVKINDHFVDSARYGLFSAMKPADFKQTRMKEKPITAGLRERRF